MRRDGRTSRTGILLIAAAVAVAGCSSDDDGLPEGLRDVSELDPVGADGNGSVDGAEPDEVPPDEADAGEPEVDPDGEPDSGPDDASEGNAGAVTVAGVVVPDSAFQINPDLDLDPDQQRELLQFSLDAYLYTTGALNTGEWDPDELASYYAGEELERNLTGHQRYDRDGLRQVNDGTLLEYIRIDLFDSAGAVIHRCTARGPRDGVIDVQTGDYVSRSEDTHRPVAHHLALVGVGGDVFEWRIVAAGVDDDVPCP